MAEYATVNAWGTVDFHWANLWHSYSRCSIKGKKMLKYIYTVYIEAHMWKHKSMQHIEIFLFTYAAFLPAMVGALETFTNLCNTPEGK